MSPEFHNILESVSAQVQVKKQEARSKKQEARRKNTLQRHYSARQNTGHARLWPYCFTQGVPCFARKIGVEVAGVCW